MLNEFRTQHKAAHRSELENEMTLLEESSAKESRLTERITVLETTLRGTEQVSLVCGLAVLAVVRELISHTGACPMSKRIGTAQSRAQLCV